MKFSLEISTESEDENIKDKCLEAVAKVLDADGAYFGVSYRVGNPFTGFSERYLEKEREVL